MKRTIRLLLALTALTLAPLLTLGVASPGDPSPGLASPGVASSAVASPEAASGSADAQKHDRAPVVLELFTSQGCSSCPPADRLLTELATRDDVLALAFHVDYWNRLGWRDPFSDPAWSERQRAYARQLGSNSYTPQLVVDGRAHAVGSIRGAVERLIDEARRRARPVAVWLDVQPAGTAVEITATIEVGPEAPRPLVVLGAVLEDARITEVERGENRGRTLRDDRIVRSLETLARLDDDALEASSTTTRRWRLAAPEPDPRQGSERRVAVLVQSVDDLSIVGAAGARLPASDGG